MTDQTGKDLEGAAELFYIQRDMGSQWRALSSEARTFFFCCVDGTHTVCRISYILSKCSMVEPSLTFWQEHPVEVGPVGEGKRGIRESFRGLGWCSMTQVTDSGSSLSREETVKRRIGFRIYMEIFAGQLAVEWEEVKMCSALASKSSINWEVDRNSRLVAERQDFHLENVRFVMSIRNLSELGSPH